METVNSETPKNKKPAVLWFGLGTLVLGTLAFFGIKHFKKHKIQNDDTTDQTTADLDTKKTVQNHSSRKPHTSLPSSNNSVSFPMHIGSQGNQVRLLQQSLIRTYGAQILAKHGADGKFGTELDSALRKKGYGVPLQESEFIKITGGKKEKEKTQEAEAPPVLQISTPLLTFDPVSIAKGIYYSLVAKNFNAALILLKSIRNTQNYSLVAEQFKIYRIGGVRKTIVNALLTTFASGSQKLKIQDALKSIGLKYDGSKWSIPNS